MFLLNDSGLIQKKNYKEASIERAVADMLYFNKRYHFDNNQLIDWDTVHRIQKGVGFV